MAESISFDIIARDLASKAFKDAGGAAEGFRGKLAAVAGLATGAFGAGITKMGEHLEETRKTLEQTISNAGQSYEEFAGQIAKAGSHEEKFGHSTADTNDAMAVLTRATGDTKKSLADMDLVTQIAAVHHSSLAEAAQVVAKAHAGAFRSLKEFGINVKDSANAAAALGKEEALVSTTSDELAKAKQKLADLLEVQHSKTKLTVADHIALRNAEEAVTKATDDNSDAVHGLARLQAEGAKAMDFATAKTLILQKIHGTAEAQANTFGGKVKELKTRFEDYAAVLGTKVGPALTVIGPALGGVGAIMSSNLLPALRNVITSMTGYAVKLVEMAGETIASFASQIAAAAVWAASMVASAAIALAPFLPFIAAIAGVGAAAYLLYRNWDTIWKAIKTATAAAVDFVKDHLVLILTIGLGPIGFAIGELATHWDTVWNGVRATIETVWKFIQPIFKALKRAVDDIAGPLGKVAGAAGTVLHAGGSVLSHLPGFAAGGYVPGQIGQPLLAVVHGGELVLNPAQQRSGLGGSGAAFHSVFNIVAPDPHRAAVSVNQGLRDAAFLLGV